MIDKYKWQECKDGHPDLDAYDGFDWVIVEMMEVDSEFIGLPTIAEYSKMNKRWHFYAIEDNEYRPGYTVLRWIPIPPRKINAYLPKGRK